MNRRARLAILFALAGNTLCATAQQLPSSAEQQLENLAEAEQAEPEDDSYLQQLAGYGKDPLNLNTADKDDLQTLRLLNDLQIANFLSYRRLLGTLVSIYELQAVPGWDLLMIRRLLPFVTVAVPLLLKEDMKKRFRTGDHNMLLRASQVVERSRGYDLTTSGTKYLGSPQRFFFRYRYSYKNLLQWGLLGDKDAGEQFFKGAQKAGFDFYSFHVFVRKIGSIQSLALGDFTVNMGQGLIQWQSLAFKKGGEAIGIKRQSPVLRPYNSAGEFNFHRGAGITIRKGRLETTAFASLRKLSANLVADTAADFFTSFQASGYHRTPGEVEDKNKLQQTAFGGSIRYLHNRWQVGLNGVYYQYSSPLQKQDEPYNRFAISGDRWYNASIDYSYTYKNLHVFGEAAIDRNRHRALLNGLLISVDPKVDLSLLHRAIAKEYQSVNGNAFTENILPTNENGLYAGVSLRPAVAWRLEAYMDIYRFPWLKFRVDGPSAGRDFFMQLTYMPDRQTEVYTRFRSESRQGNESDADAATNQLVFLTRQNWRTQVSCRIHPAITMRSRVELVWYDRRGKNPEEGFLSYLDLIYRPLQKPFSALARIQYFETDGYNARLYAYENDILYSYSIPVFSDKGYRYYLLVSYDLNRHFSFWMRWAQTIYRDATTIGSGPDEIAGPSKSEWKLQARILF